MRFTDQQVKNWLRYEQIRTRGKWNMLDRKAMVASGLSSEDYFFTLENYTALRAQATGEPHDAT